MGGDRHAGLFVHAQNLCQYRTRLTEDLDARGLGELERGIVVVPAGVGSFTISVATVDDSAVESAESLVLSVGGVAATGTITLLVGLVTGSSRARTFLTVSSKAAASPGGTSQSWSSASPTRGTIASSSRSPGSASSVTIPETPGGTSTRCTPR